MHIYLTVGKFDNDAGAFLDDAGNPTSLANYRGETGPGDDVEGYIRMMEKKGHIVFAFDDLAMPNQILSTDDGFSFRAHYNKAYSELARVLREGG